MPNWARTGQSVAVSSMDLRSEKKLANTGPRRWQYCIPGRQKSWKLSVSLYLIHSSETSSLLLFWINLAKSEWANSISMSHEMGTISPVMLTLHRASNWRGLTVGWGWKTEYSWGYVREWLKVRVPAIAMSCRSRKVTMHLSIWISSMLCTLSFCFWVTSINRVAFHSFMRSLITSGIWLGILWIRGSFP